VRVGWAKLIHKAFCSDNAAFAASGLGYPTKFGLGEISELDYNESGPVCHRVRLALRRPRSASCTPV